MVDPRWDAPIFDVYGPADCKPDGYPVAWSSPTPALLAPAPAGAVLDGDMWPPIKDLIRDLTGHRCIRCKHPYVVGQSSVRAEPPVPPGYVETTLELWEHVGAPDQPSKTMPVPGTDRRVQRPVLYSACDEQCTHGTQDERGRTIVRWRKAGEDAWRRAHLPAGPRTLGQVIGADPSIEVQAAFRILTVYHLTGEKADCRWWNLTALCQRCHLEIQNRVEMDHPWPWEHSEWFKPYVAGFYAWKYESRSISRAEAEADLERLLELERGRFELRGQRNTKGVRR